MIMNPFKFVVAAAAAVLLAGTQSVAAKPFAGSLGGLNTLLDFRVEVEDAANACDAMASHHPTKHASTWLLTSFGWSILNRWQMH